MGDTINVPGEVVAVPLILALGVLWAFLKFQPQHPNEGAVRVFNAMALVLGGIGLIIWVISWQNYLVALGREKYINFFCVGGGALGVALWLGIMLLLRNFFVFKDRSLIVKR